MLNIIQTGLNSVKKVVVMNLPGILTGMAVGGVVITGVVSFEAGMKCKEVMDENCITEENWKEEIKTLVPLVIKPVVIGGITIGCMIGSTTWSQRQQAAFASVCALNKESFKELDEKIREEYGDKKADKLHTSISEDRIKNNPPEEGKVILSGKGEYLCYEPLTARYFRADIEYVRSMINQLNEEINGGAFISVNDYCDRLFGAADACLGWDLGWSIESTGIITPRYDYTGAPSGEPVMVIEHKVKPEVKRYYDN